MLFTIATFASVMLIGAAVVQQLISVKLQRSFQQLESRRLAVHLQDRVAVLMSVRGCDPSFEKSLLGVLNQDYKNYEIFLVVDHQSDPAWQFAQQIKELHDTHDRLKIEVMSNPGPNCSLKCHSLVQAFHKMVSVSDKLPEYMVLLDGDVVPHKTWLAELVAPLLISTVGGVTGNQWFEPPRGSGMGTLCRSAWNSGSMILAINFCNPWAGSFAMRTQDAIQAKLPEIWSRSAVDDGPLAKAIHGLGKRIVFAPSIIMVNREPCTVGYVLRWTTRMLTWSRLYEGTFFLTVLHAVFSNMVMVANFVMLFVGLIYFQWGATLISLLGLIISGILSAWSYQVSRKCVARSCELRSESLSPIGWQRLTAVFWLIAPAHLIYGFSCARSLLWKQIQWRGINYQLIGGSQIQRIDYQPFEGGQGPANVSI
ncbi:MAG: glycosyltransferase family 2 protein [Planctomycetota bacterium]